MQQKNFIVTLITGKQYEIMGESPDDIFRKIDGLRLQGMRWLKVFDVNEFEQGINAFVNIDHIVSIEEVC